MNTDLVCLDNKLKEQLHWCDTKLLCHIIAFLDTQTWQRKLSVQTSEQDSEDENVDDNAEVREAVEALTVHFAKPLESKGVN